MEKLEMNPTEGAIDSLNSSVNSLAIVIDKLEVKTTAFITIDDSKPAGFSGSTSPMDGGFATSPTIARIYKLQTVLESYISRLADIVDNIKA